MIHDDIFVNKTPYLLFVPLQKFICHAHMWTINITIRHSRGGWHRSTLIDASELFSVHAHQAGDVNIMTMCVCEVGGSNNQTWFDRWQGATSYVQVCVLCVLYLLYCPNRQLPLPITINFTIHVSWFPFSSLMGVCMYVCTFTYCMCTVMWLMSPA